MRKSQVLCILRPLIPDLQERIFWQIFHTRDEIQGLLLRQCPSPSDLVEIDDRLKRFVYSEEEQMMMSGLTGRGRKFVYERCLIFQLKYKAFGGWPDYTSDEITIRIFKPSDWWLDANIAVERVKWAGEIGPPKTSKAAKKSKSYKQPTLWNRRGAETLSFSQLNFDEEADQPTWQVTWGCAFVVQQ